MLTVRTKGGRLRREEGAAQGLRGPLVQCCEKEYSIILLVSQRGWHKGREMKLKHKQEGRRSTRSRAGS